MGAQKKEEKDVRELFVATFTGTYSTTMSVLVLVHLLRLKMKTL